MHMITEQLAVGNAADAACPQGRISVILNVAADDCLASPPGAAYRWIPFKEFAAADPVRLDEAVTWLEQQDSGSCLLICCRAGMGRSVSVAVAYLCVAQGMSYPEAVRLVSARRPGATPLPRLEETIQRVREIRLTRRRKADAGIT